MSPPRVPSPPPLAKRYINYMLSFGVSVGIGLSPLIGKWNIPGFSALLSLYPSNLASIIIPFTALLMSVPTLALQYHASGFRSLVRLNRWFTRALISIVILLVLGIAFYLFLVVRVPVEGGKEYATYAIGFKQVSLSPCAGTPLKICIGRKISFDPGAVEALFPDWQ